MAPQLITATYQMDARAGARVVNQQLGRLAEEEALAAQLLMVHVELVMEILSVETSPGAVVVQRMDSGMSWLHSYNIMFYGIECLAQWLQHLSHKIIGLQPLWYYDSESLNDDALWTQWHGLVHLVKYSRSPSSLLQTTCIHSLNSSVLQLMLLQRKHRRPLWSRLSIGSLPWPSSNTSSRT